MLKIPSFRQVGDVTVYQDDAVWHRFYLVPSKPTIRLDAEEHPVFLLALYHFSEQARENDEDLPRGAGYMNFDVEMVVDEELHESIVKELQEWVDEQHRQQRGRGRAPTVELAAPLLSGGTVQMHTTQSDALATNRLAEVEASLVAGSAAVFNVDLTSEGANFMRGLLVDESGEGQLDLTPLQIVYDMRMWGRLPPVKITVSADSKRVHETLLKVSETNRDNRCTPAEVETHRENGMSSSTLRETGLVKVEIDKGDATLPEEALEALQNFALDMFDKMISERFLVPAEEDDTDFELDDTGIANPEDPGWVAVLYSKSNYDGATLEVRESMPDLGSLGGKIGSIKMRPGHSLTLYTGKNQSGNARTFRHSRSTMMKPFNKSKSVRITRSPTSRSKVRKTVNYSEMNLEISIDRSQVVEWPIGGQATLETFFSGMSASEIGKHVVDIHDDFFKTLAIDVTAYADFEDSPIAAVEVQVEYPGGAVGGGDPPSNTFTFNAENTEPQRFDPAVIDGERDYRYRYRIIYRDDAAGDYTEWERTRNRDLNIPALDPGKIQLEVSASSLDWQNVVKSVIAKLSYTHPSGTERTYERTFELLPAAPIAEWEVRTRKSLDGEIHATFEYHLQDDKVLQGTPRTISPTDNRVVVRPPQVDTLDVTLVPTGYWDDVVQAVVSLHYEADDDLVYDETFTLRAIDEIVTWSVLLRDPNRREYTYEVLVSYKNGESEHVPPKTHRDGDGALEINVKGNAPFEVAFLTALLDFDLLTAVTATVEYGDERKTLTFTRHGTQKFSVPMREDGERDYTYELTWHTKDGESISSGLQRGTEDQLLIPRPPVAQPGKLDVMVRAFAVDFAATPYVDISLSWSDGDTEETGLVTLHQGQPTTKWSIDIGDRSNKRFSYSISYNLANGDVVAGASGTSTTPVVSVKPYQPEPEQ